MADELAAKYRLNQQIRAREVRLVGDNVTVGVYSLVEALRIADDLELDLVEVSPNADPPVCRIVDFQKFLYDQKKKQKEIKAKTTKVVLKEVRFGLDQHLAKDAIAEGYIAVELGFIVAGVSGGPVLGLGDVGFSFAAGLGAAALSISVVF